MVSEHGRRHTYTAAISGETSQEVHTTPPPIVRSPNRSASMAPQRNHTSQQQRSSNSKDLENPFVLSQNENASAVLVNPLLAGTANYGAWCISMRIALEVKNKWGFVDGSIIAPNRDNPQYAAWRRYNLMVCSWLFKDVHHSIAQSVMHMDQARNIWEDLRRRFSQHDAQKISKLQSRIYNLKQGNI